jgi:hypothetical protein
MVSLSRLSSLKNMDHHSAQMPDSPAPCTFLHMDLECLPSGHEDAGIIVVQREVGCAGRHVVPWWNAYCDKAVLRLIR